MKIDTQDFILALMFTAMVALATGAWVQDTWGPEKVEYRYTSTATCRAYQPIPEECAGKFEVPVEIPRRGEA